MTNNIRIKLSSMMFLEFFTWGAWYVTMGTYLDTVLQASGMQIGLAYSALAIATIVSPFLTGVLADRFFASQKLLGLLHLTGAVLLYCMTYSKTADAFFWILLIYSLLYAPTLALVNSISFRSMKEASKEFAFIRVFGTLGWIASGWIIDKWFHLDAHELAFTFKLSAVSSLLLGILSFFLPNAPPPAKQVPFAIRKLAGIDALVLLKDKSFLVFFLCSIFICIPLSFYYGFANLYLISSGMSNATSYMTLGQVSEVLFILLIPFLFNRWGIKWMIVIAAVAWMLRFALFGYGNMHSASWMFIAAILLHGICFDFFFVTGQIYTENKAGVTSKAAAQGLITMATYGIGMWIGTTLSGYVKDKFTYNNIVDWRAIWLTPAFIAFGVLLFFIVFFRNKSSHP